MKAYRCWSLRYKLLSILLLFGNTTFVVTGAISYTRHIRSLKETAVNQLTSVRRSKAYQLESYYRTIHRHIETLSGDWMFIDAMREFRAAYDALDLVPVSEEQHSSVTKDYYTRVYPQMQALHIARPRFEDYVPVAPAAFHLQYSYIVNNPAPAGHLREMKSANDGSAYSRVHLKYHEVFRRLVETFGYYDLYLIDGESGRVLYDVNKDRDLGTSLRFGPYRDSNLAKVVRHAFEAANPGAVFFSDCEHYEANLGEPTQWVAAPIFDGPRRSGVLVLQISLDHVEDVVSGQRGWEKDGLGKTGRSVIIGQDYFIRTNLRAFLESPETFLRDLRTSGGSEETLARIRAHNSTVLELEMRVPSTSMALDGKEGSTIEPYPFGPNLTLVSFMPLNIEGVHWVFQSRMDLREALAPVVAVEHFFVWWGAVLLLVTVGAAMFITRRFMRPVNALARAAQRLGAGMLEVHVECRSHDELGMLCDTFNAMALSIRDKTRAIEQKNRENEALLLNILPGEIATRLKCGEKDIADSYADVTVLFGDLVGFTTLSTTISPDELVDMLNGLFCRFDHAASELGIEKIKTIGDCYMAVCGLPQPCPDHTERIAHMALRMVEAVREYSVEQGVPLQLRIGLNSGPVVAGVIGTSKFIYDLWGDTVNLASRMESTGLAGEIQVTRSVYERLKNTFEFEPRGEVQVKGKGTIQAWLLHRGLRAPIEGTTESCNDVIKDIMAR